MVWLAYLVLSTGLSYFLCTSTKGSKGILSWTQLWISLSFLSRRGFKWFTSPKMRENHFSYLSFQKKKRKRKVSIRKKRIFLWSCVIISFFKNQNKIIKNPFFTYDRWEIVPYMNLLFSYPKCCITYFVTHKHLFAIHRLRSPKIKRGCKIQYTIY